MNNRRMIGTAFYTSDKLLSVPEEHRVEYPWLLPLVEPNACLEYSVPVIWSLAYSLMKPSMTPQTLQAVIDSYIEAKLIFPFEHQGKRYLFFVGMENYLPAPSHRGRYAKGSGIVPAKELAKFLGISMKEAETRFAHILDTSRRRQGGVRTKSCKVNANANVDVNADDNVNAQDNVEGNGNETEQDESQQHHGRRHHGQQPTLSSPASQGAAEATNPALQIATEFHTLIAQNPSADRTKIPTKWEKLWVQDFETLLMTYSPTGLRLLCEFSQAPSQQQFYVRPASLVKNHELLAKRFKVPTRAQEATMPFPVRPELNPPPVARPPSFMDCGDDTLDCLVCKTEPCTC